MNLKFLQAIVATFEVRNYGVVSAPGVGGGGEREGGGGKGREPQGAAGQIFLSLSTITSTISLRQISAKKRDEISLYTLLITILM